MIQKQKQIKTVPLEELKEYLKIQMQKVGEVKVEGKLPKDKMELADALLDIYLHFERRGRE